jgi:hypothetical protein
LQHSLHFFNACFVWHLGNNDEDIVFSAFIDMILNEVDSTLEVHCEILFFLCLISSLLFQFPQGFHHAQVLNLTFHQPDDFLILEAPVLRPSFLISYALSNGNFQFTN